MSAGGSRNSKEQRRDNAYRILGIIRSSKIDVSRKILTESTGLSFPSVNDIVNYLIDFDLIEQYEGEGQTRKKVPCYRFSGEKYAVLGLAIQSQTSIGVCCDLSGNVLHQFKITNNRDNDIFVNDIIGSFNKIATKVKLDNRVLLGIGVGCPGLVDHKNKKIVYSSQFHQLEEIDLIKILEDSFNIPVFIEHNPNLNAFVENKLGVTKDLSDFIYVILDVGIGGSLLHAGRLFHGDSLFMGEIGHSTVQIDGHQCTCGNRGCLEMYVGENVLRQNMDKCVDDASKAKVINSAAEQIGMTVSNLICFLGIGNVVFGGSSVRNFPELFYKTREVMLSRTLPLFRPKLDIRKSTLEEQSPSVGAALWTGEIAISNLSSRFFGDKAPELPLTLNSVIKISF